MAKSVHQVDDEACAAATAAGCDHAWGKPHPHFDRFTRAISLAVSALSDSAIIVLEAGLNPFPVVPYVHSLDLPAWWLVQRAVLSAVATPSSADQALGAALEKYVAVLREELPQCAAE